MKAYLETQRLVLRPPVEKDIDYLMNLFAKPELMTLVGGPRPESVTRKIFGDILGHWGRYGFGTCIAHDRDRQPVGIMGFKHLTLRGVPQVDLGCLIDSPHQKRGLAKEGLEALVHHGFRHQKFESIIATTHQENRTASKLVEKLGFRNEGEVTVEYGGTTFVEAACWEMTLASYFKLHGIPDDYAVL